MNCDDKNHKRCKYLKKRNDLIIRFLLDTGARISDVAGVRVKDLNYLEPEGHFHKSYTKRKKTRLFILDKKLWEELLDFIGNRNSMSQEHSKIFNLSKRSV